LAVAGSGGPTVVGAIIASFAAGWTVGDVINQVLYKLSGGQSFGGNMYGIQEEQTRFAIEFWKNVGRKAKRCATAIGDVGVLY
jgi:hypothetical protein